MTIENSQLYSTESLHFSLSCVNSPTGQCPCPCNYQLDPSCSCRDLTQNITVGLTKTPVYALYPLSQPKLFNGRPTEAYITTGYGGTGGSSCSDDPLDLTPTCGWAKIPNADGVLQIVPDSEGFCCRCPTLGGATIPRGWLSCSWKPGWLTSGVPGSAHCLRYDDYWWYRGYQIGPYQIDFDIQLQINSSQIPPSPLPSNNISSSAPGPPPLPNAPVVSSQQVLSVNPSQTFTMNADRTVSVQLLGDLQSYSQIQVLDGYWVMIPIQPGLLPDQIFTSNLDMWVVLPPNLVTTTGECNKVGVSYSAFRYQGDACGEPLGSCLSNQIYDLGVQDSARIASGLPPLYNITRYGGGWANTQQVTSSALGSGANSNSTSSGLVLRLPLAGVRTSLVTLEVSADSLQLVTNLAPGKILSWQVCTFDNVHCGSFEAIAGQGYLEVEVQNIGSVPADFIVSAVHCSPGILPVLEQRVTIAAGATTLVTLQIMTSTDQAGNNTCSAIVTDAQGLIADSTQIHFYTNATTYEPPPSQSNLGGKQTGPGTPQLYSRCSTTCPNIFNIACHIVHGCWKRLIQSFLVFLAVIVVVTVLWVLIRKGILLRVIRSSLQHCFPPPQAPPASSNVEPHPLPKSLEQEEKKLKGQATGTELPQDRPSFLIPAAYGSCSWPSTSTSLTDAPHPKMVFNPLFASQVHQSSCFQPTQTENKTVTPFARSLYNYYNNAQSPDRDKCVLHHSIAPAPVRGGSTAADVDVDAVDIYRKE